MAIFHSYVSLYQRVPLQLDLRFLSCFIMFLYIFFFFPGHLRGLALPSAEMGRKLISENDAHHEVILSFYTRLIIYQFLSFVEATTSLALF